MPTDPRTTPATRTKYDTTADLERARELAARNAAWFAERAARRASAPSSPRRPRRYRSRPTAR